MICCRDDFCSVLGMNERLRQLIGFWAQGCRMGKRAVYARLIIAPWWKAGPGWRQIETIGPRSICWLGNSLVNELCQRFCFFCFVSVCVFRPSIFCSGCALLTSKFGFGDVFSGRCVFCPATASSICFLSELGDALAFSCQIPLCRKNEQFKRVCFFFLQRVLILKLHLYRCETGLRSRRHMPPCLVVRSKRCDHRLAREEPFPTPTGSTGPTGPTGSTGPAGLMITDLIHGDKKTLL